MVTAAVSVLALALSACGGGGGGGGPGSLSSDEEWQIEVTGARSFTATGYPTNVASEVDSTGMLLVPIARRGARRQKSP